MRRLLRSSMRRAPSAFLCAASAALAGCATTPRQQAPHAAADLTLCAGRVANAPATDSAGRIEDFAPFAEIRGMRVARAPVEACLSSGFGPRRGGAGDFHYGVDLYTGAPRPVRAAARGVVETAGRVGAFGDMIEIRHDRGVRTRYAHLSSFAPGLRPGARIEAGETIGFTGRSGNASAIHLHYEILIDGRAVNPLTVGK